MNEEMEPFSRASDYVDEPVPVAPIGLVPLKGTEAIASAIDSFLVGWRKERSAKESGQLIFSGYVRDSYILDYDVPRFGSGEAKGVLKTTARGLDLYFYVDVTNHNVTYSMGGVMNRYSPDDHYQDLKRMISTAAGQAKRMTVIMPFLYEGRVHNRRGRESLDCAMMLKELVAMGVDNVITFEANDARVVNAIPLASFDTVMPTYQYIKALCNRYDDIILTSDSLCVVSPDDSGMSRAIYMANVLGVDAGMFYDRKNYGVDPTSRVPSSSKEYLGPPVEGRDIIIVDDMISSGGTCLGVARMLKERGAKRVFVCACFGLFTGGLDRFDEAFAEGTVDRILTTNLIYQRPELFSKKWYANVNMGKYVALLIDYLNHDDSISALLTPNDRIMRYLAKYKERQQRKGIVS